MRETGTIWYSDNFIYIKKCHYVSCSQLLFSVWGCCQGGSPNLLPPSTDWRMLCGQRQSVMGGSRACPHTHNTSAVTYVSSSGLLYGRHLRVNTLETLIGGINILKH